MDDLISRQAAISAICNACGKIDCDKMDKCEKLQLPPANCSEFPNNSDVVDRQKAKNAICNACGKIDCDEMDTCEKLDIPSEGSKLLQPWEVLAAQAVLSQPKRGRWIHHPEIGWGETWLCDQCGEKTTSTVMGKPRANFCPNCGAKMEVTT